MRRRHPLAIPLPDTWLMTDERLGEALWTALRRLPRGGGVVFRHHATPPTERRRMLTKVARIARSRGLLLLVAGGDRLGHGAAGRHGGTGRAVSRSVHDLREARKVRASGAAVVFVSPMFATRSHPGARPLPRMRAAALVRAAGVSAIALGGMDARRFRQVRRLGFHGWAAIDAWGAATRKTPDQKRKAVPI